MWKTSVVLMSCLFSSVALATTTYVGQHGAMDGNDVLTLAHGQAVIVANCGSLGGGGRVALSIAKETNKSLILKGSSKVFSMQGGTGHTVEVPIVMNFRKLPNGDLKLYGKSPSMSSLYGDHGASCSFGLSHSEYENKPYNVVFMPNK